MRLNRRHPQVLGQKLLKKLLKKIILFSEETADNAEDKVDPTDLAFPSDIIITEKADNDENLTDLRLDGRN